MSRAFGGGPSASGVEDELCAPEVGDGRAVVGADDHAVWEGKWIDRPKTGYDLVDGEFFSNGQADTIRRIFGAADRRLFLQRHRGTGRV